MFEDSPEIRLQLIAKRDELKICLEQEQTKLDEAECNVYQLEEWIKAIDKVVGVETEDEKGTENAEK